MPNDDTPGGPVDPEIVAARDILRAELSVRTPPRTAAELLAVIRRAEEMISQAIARAAA